MRPSAPAWRERGDGQVASKSVPTFEFQCTLLESGDQHFFHSMVLMDLATAGERLRNARETQRPRVSQRDAARLLEIPEDRYRSYEYDRAQLPEEHAKKLAAEWSVPWRYFYEGNPLDSLMGGTDEERKRLTAGMAPIRLLGAASAGPGTAPHADEGEIYVPLQMAKSHYFGLPVDGDSMYDLLHPGDLAVFDEWKKWQLGDVVAFRRESGDDGIDWIVKQVKHTGTDFVLHSLNIRHADIEQGNWIAKGVLVGYVREIGPEMFTRYSPHGIRP